METARETKLPWWGWMGGLCLLPVLYVLSVFPVALVLQRLGVNAPEWYVVFYSPVFWAMDQWECFRAPMELVAEKLGLLK